MLGKKNVYDKGPVPGLGIPERPFMLVFMWHKM